MTMQIMMTHTKDRPIALALKILVFIAVLYTLYFCRTLLLPILVAGFIALFSSPLVRLLVTLKIPRYLAAAFVSALLMISVGALFMFLAEPASQWLKSLPILSNELTAQMTGISASFNSLKESVIPQSAADGNSLENIIGQMFLSAFSVMAETTAMFVVQIATVFVITYFFLVYGDNLMRNLVRAQSSFSEKKKMVVIFQTVRDDISRYVLLISIINVGVGIATAGAMMLLGIKDPFLWGALATILNFAPYIGPILASLIFTGVGFIEFGSFTHALLVPGAFLLFHLIESQLITPMALGRRFNLNPLLVVLWMFAWGWVWGVIGLLIAIPLLVCFKIFSTHLDLLGSWINVLDADTTSPTKL